MSRFWKRALCAMLVGAGLAMGSACVAAGDMMNFNAATAQEPKEQSWYREQTPAKPDSKAIVQQKAQVRAQQRMDRLASLNWYGMSNSRPQASGTPFTGRYSPVWEMPGGRPYAWYPQSRPGYVLYWR